MILETLLGLIFGLINLIFLPFDGLTFVVGTNIFSVVLQYLSFIFYILPIQNFLPIISFVIGMMALRIVISLLKTIWAILPFI